MVPVLCLLMKISVGSRPFSAGFVHVLEVAHSDSVSLPAVEILA